MAKNKKDLNKIKEDLLNYIEPNIYNCYQCGKCTASCPMVDVFEYKPNQIIRLVLMDRIDKILDSNSIFLCLSCEICSSRCPQEVHIATIMNFIRNESWKLGEFKIKNIARFYNIFLRLAGIFGRSFEPGLIMGMNILSGRFFNDADVAVKILRKRKIKMLPEFIKGRKQVSKVIKKYL